MTAEIPVPAPLPAAATVSMLDVFAKIVEMHATLAVISEQLKQLPDHEQRLRALEAARARLAGACLTVSALAGGGAGWAALALSRR